MKCTICGQEMSPNDQFCLNCGTKRSEMNSTFGSNPNAGQQYSYGGNGFSNTSYKPVRGGSLVAVRVIVTLLVLAIGCGIFFGRNILTHKVDCGSFTIKLPYSFDDDNDFGTSFASTGGEKRSAAYSNDDMGFAYVEYSMSDLGLDAVNKAELPSLFVSLMDSMMESREQGYNKVSVSGNTLKCTYTDDEGKKVYAIIKCEVHKDSFYMFIYMCKDSGRSRYEPKLEKYAGSLKFK